MSASWRKSSYSAETANCVEVSTPAWRAASACHGGSCVEVGRSGPVVLVRHSKLGDESPVLEYTPEEWVEVLSAVRAGFLPHWATEDGSYRRPTGGVVWTTGPDSIALQFTAAEWEAFEAGVRSGDFDPPESAEATP